MIASATTANCQVPGMRGLVKIPKIKPSQIRETIYINHRLEQELLKTKTGVIINNLGKDFTNTASKPLKTPQVESPKLEEMFKVNNLERDNPFNTAVKSLERSKEEIIKPKDNNLERVHGNTAVTPLQRSQVESPRNYLQKARHESEENSDMWQKICEDLNADLSIEDLIRIEKIFYRRHGYENYNLQFKNSCNNFNGSFNTNFKPYLNFGGQTKKTYNSILNTSGDIWESLRITKDIRCNSINY